MLVFGYPQKKKLEEAEKILAKNNLFSYLILMTTSKVFVVSHIIPLITKTLHTFRAALFTSIGISFSVLHLEYNLKLPNRKQKHH